MRVVFTIFVCAYFIHFWLKMQKQKYLLISPFGTSKMAFYGHSSFSIEHINSLASFFIISHHFLSKNQNLDLFLLYLAWDLQGGRDHHFHLLSSSILISWDSFSQRFGKKFLKLSYLLIFHHFHAKLLCLGSKICFSSFGSLRLQDLSFCSLTISWKLHSR